MTARLRPFEVRPLKRVTWWRRLFGFRQPENAAVELENVLVGTGPTLTTIATALAPYKLPGERMRHLLRDTYRKALIHCLADDALADDEVAYLAGLRGLLNLSDTDLAKVESETIHPRFEKAVAEVLADAHVSERERAGLRDAQRRLCL